MDRALGKPSESQQGTLDRAEAALASAALMMKQISWQPSETCFDPAALSNAHDNDGTYNKEFYR